LLTHWVYRNEAAKCASVNQKFKSQEMRLTNASHHMTAMDRFLSHITPPATCPSRHPRMAAQQL